MRENRTSGSEGGEAQTNELSLPLSLRRSDRTTEWGSLSAARTSREFSRVC